MVEPRYNENLCSQVSNFAVASGFAHHLRAQAMEALMRWKTMLLEFKHPVDGPLFVNETFKRLSSRSVQFRLKNLAIRAGLPIHVHPHMLRHSFASHVLQSSGDLRAVQEMLGHASIASTQIYKALDFQHLAQAYDQAHPRAKNKKVN